MVLAADTLPVPRVASPPTLDGVAGISEYGSAQLEFTLPAGPATLWLRWDDGALYLAARIPDSTPSWADALTILLDTDGDRADAPQHDDFQWDLHRVLDSSVVYRGEGGRWRTPRDDPDWRLGKGREGGGWEVRAVSSAEEWMVEIRFDVDFFRQASRSLPALAVRLFDDDGQTWVAWPRVSHRAHPSEVERHPSDWAPVRLD